MKTALIPFTTYQESVYKALDELGASDILSKQKSFLIKPNLINASPHPITTPVECCEAIVQYIRKHSEAPIILAEGCGDSVMETDEVFEKLNYDRLAEQYRLELLDLNHAPTIKVQRPGCLIFEEMILPTVAFSHYIISVPVLKAHSLARITGTLKNMMGFPPPKYYSGRFGSWKKAVFHGQMQDAIKDLNQYILPDLSIMDATVGLAEFHLGGSTCKPPVNKILAGFDPYEVDRKAADLLGFRWEEIPHLHRQ